MELKKILRPLYVIGSTAATLLVYGIVINQDPGMIAGGVIVILVGIFYVFLICYRNQRQRHRQLRKQQLQKEWETKYGNAQREKNIRTNMNYYPPYSRMPAITVKGLLMEPPVKPVKDRYGNWSIPFPSNVDDRSTSKSSSSSSSKKTVSIPNVRLTTLEECLQAEANLRSSILSLQKYWTLEGENESLVTSTTGSNPAPRISPLHSQSASGAPLNEILVQQVSPLVDVPSKDGKGNPMRPFSDNDNPSLLSSSSSSRSPKALSSSPSASTNGSGGWFSWWNTGPPPKTIPNCPTSLILKLFDTIIQCSVHYTNTLLCCSSNPLEWYGLGGPERARVDLLLSAQRFYGIQRHFWNHECALSLGDALFSLSVACGYVQDELEKLREQQRSSSTGASIATGMVIGTGLAMALQSHSHGSQEEMDKEARQAGNVANTTGTNTGGGGEEDSEPPDIEEFLDSEEGETVFDTLGEWVEQLTECMACAGGSNE